MKTQSDHELSRLEAVGNGSYLYRWDIHSEEQEQPSEDGEGVTTRTRSARNRESDNAARQGRK